jgi:hypothetical protein
MPRTLTFLEQVVWDALKNSICPPEHRYSGPGKSLPCRWCRTGQAILAVLDRMIQAKILPEEMRKEIESQIPGK